MSKVILSEITNSKGSGILKLSPGTKLDLSKSNEFLQLPTGTTEERPDNADLGEVRYNTDFKTIEYYDGLQWNQIEFPYDGDELSNAGVVWELDASNPDSYSGSGNRWYSLRGTGSEYATKAGSQSPAYPEFNQEGEVGYFKFTGGVNGNNYSRFDIGSPEMETMTAITWHRPTGTYGHVFRMNNDDYQIGPDNYCAGERFNDVQVTHSIYGNPVAPDKLNQWNFDAVTWDNQTVRAYHNGVYGGANTRSVAKNINAGSLRIGARSDIYAAHYVGDISYVKLYNRQLTDAEIWNEYVKLAPRFGINPIPSIVTNGLVLNLDAANYQSYPRSGSIVSDLTKVSNSGNLINGTIYENVNGGTFTFDGVDDEIIINDNNLARIGGSNHTIIAWVNNDIVTEEDFIGTGTSSGDVLLMIYSAAAGGQGGFRGHVWSTNSSNTLDSPRPIGTGNWNMLTQRVTWGGNIDLFENGVLTNSRALSGSAVTSSKTQFIIGCRSSGGNSSHFDGKIAVVQVYNRALSNVEINQNFDALRTRYGL